MERSEQINELAGALAKAQATLPAVPKRGRGQVGTQKTQYATLDDVINTARGPLADNGLAFSQMLDSSSLGGATLTTTLIHESGQWMSASAPIEAMDPNRGTNAMQAFGSTLTYLKRYALAAMLGVTTDEDDDGRRATRAPQRTSQPNPQTRPTNGGNGNGHQPPPPEGPRDLWDEEAQSGGETRSPSIDVAEVGVFLTKTGKPHIGLMEDGHQWPDIRWWKGRTELLEAAPWLIETCTHDDLVGDARFPFAARVYYTEDAKGYKTAERFERIAAAVPA